MLYETRKPIISDIFIPFGVFVRMLSNGGMSEQELRRECPQLSHRELRTVMAYALSLPANLEDRFHLLMHDSYWVCGNFTKAKTGKGYWPHYQLRSVREHGGRSAVKRYLARPHGQEGFDRVQALGMIEFSIEAFVLQAPWSSLFTPLELGTARGRLAAVGYRAAQSPDTT